MSPTLLFLLNLVVTASAALAVDERRSRTQVQQFVTEATSIILSHLKETARTVALYTDETPDVTQVKLTSSLHSALALPVFVLGKTILGTLHMPRQSTAFIIMCGSGEVHAFMRRLWLASKTPLWRSWYTVIFIDTDLTRPRKDITFNLLETSWRKYETLNSLEITMLLSADGLETHAVANCFNPFVSKGKSSSAKIIQRINQNLFINARGYPIKLPAHDYPPFMYEVTKPNGEKTLGGIIGDVAELIFKPPNMTAITQRNTLVDLSRWALSDSFYQETPDITYPFTLLQSQRLYRSTYPYMIEKFVIIVPKAQQVPPWMTAALPFTKPLWLMYLFFYPVLVSVGKLCSLFSGSNTQLSFQGMELFRLFLLGMIQHQIKSAWFRMYVGSILFTSIVLNNAYSGSFTSYITIPQFYDDVTRLDEIDNLYLSVKVPSVFGTNIAFNVTSFLPDIDFDDKITNIIFGRLKVVNNLEDALCDVIVKRRDCVLYFSTGAKYELSKPEYFQNLRPLLHLIEQTFFSVYAVAEFRENCPFSEIVNNYLWLSRESGLIEKILSNTFGENFSNYDKTESVKVPLSINHLQGFFYVLFLGFVFSVLAFTTEISWVHFWGR
ncbi:uncharacterized protein LOC134537170 [Bacillus rossius redtenbacheri]|uniref:uncharacterized protein LOC134537170 n=1 Tax=Bacillus rossius redtenbacheri TaxID=93214 RepID=UPI002FDDD70F